MATLACSLADLAEDLSRAFEEDHWNEEARGREVTEILVAMLDLAHKHVEQVLETDRLIRRMASVKVDGDRLLAWERSVVENLERDLLPYERLLEALDFDPPAERLEEPGYVVLDASRIQKPISTLISDIQRARNLIAFCGGGHAHFEPLSAEEMKAAEDAVRAAWGQ